MSNNKHDTGDLLTNIFNLVRDQQEISERVSKLVESMMMDVGKIRENSERVALLALRIDQIESRLEAGEDRRDACVEAVADRFSRMEQKREENKDRVNSLEREVNKRFSEMKEGILSQVGDMKEKAAYSAGKYGAIAALIISIVTMILGWIINHPHK